MPRRKMAAISARILICLIVTAITALGQAPPIDPEVYRQEKQRATAIFLDKKQTVQARLAAVPKLGYPEEQTFAALLEIGRDLNENSAIRAAALRRHRVDEKYFDVVMKILEDPQDGDEELDTNLILDVSQRVTFRSPLAFRQRFQAVLRRLLDDPRNRVRLQAYRTLVVMHDSIAVNRLSEGLRTGQNIPVPLPEAISLLNEDGPVNHISVIRPYINHADPAVRAQAARVLSVDPATRPKIVEMLRSSQTPSEVRLLALRALAREDERFTEYAIPLVESARGDSQIRQAAMKAVVGRMNYNKVDEKSQIRFAEAVKRISDESGVRNDSDKSLKSAAGELFAYLIKAFPVIRQHYARR